MIDILYNFVSIIAGLVTAGLGFTVILAGIKILLTGFGWMF